MEEQKESMKREGGDMGAAEESNVSGGKAFRCFLGEDIVSVNMV